MEYKKFTEREKSVFRRLLENNTKEDFNKEFIRITNLKRQLINTFGFEAILNYYSRTEIAKIIFY